MPYRQGKKWRAVVTHQGKRYQALLPTKKEAVEWETQKRKELKCRNQKTGTAFFTFLSRYLDHVQARHVPLTYAIKKSVFERFVLATRVQSIEEVTPDLIERYLIDQKNQRSDGAANVDRKQLLALFNWGKKILDLDVNPVEKVPPFPTDRKKQYTPPEVDVLKVLAVATGPDLVLLNVMVHTGARRSEVFRLTWHDVNFEKKEITLWTRKSKDQSMKDRTLPMNGTLQKHLRWLWENREFKDSPYVFVCNKIGLGYGKPYTTRRAWIPGLCRKAKVKPFSFHALRRYVASMLNDKHKISSKTIQRILGHSNVRTTEIYLHNINDDLREVMNKLG